MASPSGKAEEEMSPSGTTQADEKAAPRAPSREELLGALADREVAELQEMAKRLARSHEDMEETLKDLEVEQQALRDESAHVRETIELMMREMHKLNIGAGNTVEPTLDEGPLNFVGRFWEKVRPRDTAVVVSEHVGEIRKPVPTEGGSPVAQQIAQQIGGQISERSQQALEQGKQALEQGKQAVQHGKEAWGRLSQSIGPLWQRAEGLLAARDGASPAAQPKAERKKKREKANASASSDAAPETCAPEDNGEDSQAVSESPAAEVTPAASSASATEPTPAPATGGYPATAPVPAPESTPTSADAKPAKAEPRTSTPEEQVSSTILIEAKITIDDGSLQLLQVRAADRCKEVAHRFVQEHSLKAWFEDPLTAWLKKVEADAEKFPVKLEADLIEIRKAHMKGK